MVIISYKYLILYRANLILHGNRKDLENSSLGEFLKFSNNIHIISAMVIV